MPGFRIAHVGLHVRNLEEEIAFLAVIGASVTATDTMRTGRIAFVSLDGELHHSLALFENGEPLASGDSQKERQGIDHIALPTGTRADVDGWAEKLTAAGIAWRGPYIQGPEGGGLPNGSGSYSIFFNDPNGICFEIYAEAMSVAAFRAFDAERKAETAPA